MRKALTFLTASLVLTWVAPVLAQQAPDQFKDVEPNHWGYQAMESLRAKGIVIGYPDGYFRGRRTLTRYEFAVALDRALKLITSTPGEKGAQGEVGPAGPAGPQGEPGTPANTEDIEALKKLTKEFKDELASMGNSINAINAKLDAIAKDLAALKEAFEKMPKISGGAFFGVRADRAHGGYIDRNFAEHGFVFTTPTSDARATSFFTTVPTPIFRDPTVVHDFQLGVDAKIAGGATLSAKINENNYIPTLGGNAAVAGGFVKNASSTVYLSQMEIRAPFGALGREGGISIGRFNVQGAKYMLWKPDVDVYLDDPFVNTGAYIVDGVKIDAKLGSVGLEAFGAQTKSVTDTAGNRINIPLAGAVDLDGSLVSMPVDQLVGISGRLPIRLMGGGYLRLAALGTSQNLVFTPDVPDTALILGADGLIKPTERIGVKLDWAKSIAGRSDFRTFGDGSKANTAFEGKVSYDANKLKVAAGYKYIDPLFYAPGYWDRLAMFLNPVNVKGPTGMIHYAFGDNLVVRAGGEWLSGARHTDLAQLQPEDDWNKVTAGVKYNITKSAHVSVDWEGDYLRIDTGEGVIHPTMQYVMIGTGYNITSGTLVKIGYEIGDVNDKGIGLFGPVPGHFNYNVLTTQVAVKF